MFDCLVLVGLLILTPFDLAFGAGNNKRVGSLLERQIIIHLLLVVPPVAMVWWNAEFILIALHQPPAIAALAGEYLRW